MGNVKLLKASAGSGKTYQLAYEYIRNVIAEPHLYRHILAVTFTNKATEEMKRRILSEINDLARGIRTSYLDKLTSDLSLSPQTVRERALSARTKILHDYSRFSVLTIDKFFQRIIRSFIKELGIDLNFNLELKTETLLSAAADQLIDEIPIDEQLKKWMTGFVEEKIEENRRWEMKSELVKLGREVFTESYRSSSAALVSKEELGKIVSEASSSAFKVIATLREKARVGIDIMTTNGLCFSDFSGGSRSFTNYFGKIAGGDIAAPGTSVMAALESDEKWCSKTSPRRSEVLSVACSLRPILAEIVAIYDQNVLLLNSVELLRTNYRNFALLTDLASKIESIGSEQSILPISETNHILNKLIEGNDTPFIFEKSGNHFSRFMIDEFQDTSAMQWQNFLPLLRNAISQSEYSPVLLVGDVKQSIYRWRGGDWRILGQQIEKEFGALLSIDLTTNYRSLGRIVEFNNTIIGKCVEIDNLRLNNDLTQAAVKKLIGRDTEESLHDTLRSAYENHRQESIKGDGLGFVGITVYDKDEASDSAIPPVITTIEHLQQRGYVPGDIAILVRTGADGIRIANLLLEHKQKNPASPFNYDIVTQEALLIASSPVIGFVMSCFKLAAIPSLTINLAVYNKWLGNNLDSAPTPEETDFFVSLRLLPPEEAFEQVVMRYALNTDQSDIAYLQAFHEHVISFSASSVSDMRLFIKWWDENGGNLSVNIPGSADAIAISTIHKAKGLQYKVVIIPYCNWSLNPHARSIIWADGRKTAEGLGDIPVGFGEKMKNSYMAEDYYRELVMSHVDNMNIFYVAVTRAIEELHIMMPADKRRKEDRINTLVLDSIAVNAEEAFIGNMKGKVVSANSDTLYCFGEPMLKKTSLEQQSRKIFAEFGSYDISARLILKTRGERYVDDGDQPTLTPRNYGILMHRVFQNSASMEDVSAAINELEASGELTAAETEHLDTIIRKALENRLVLSWFSDDWDTVRNENDIIVPRSVSQRRPDRVMIRGREAVIVDYKFGLGRAASHRKQIAEYAELMKRMGFEKVDGYIWYVSLNDIERVV